MNDHADIYAAETAALEPTDWERWIDRVKQLMGHDADGDLIEDGYSLDTFGDMYEAGLTPEQASMRIVGAICVDSEGSVYRWVLASDYRYGSHDVGKWQSLRSEFPTVDRLPASAVLVWAPDRDGVTAFAICCNCGTPVQGSWLSTSEWRASAHCGECLNHGGDAFSIDDRDLATWTWAQRQKNRAPSEASVEVGPAFPATDVSTSRKDGRI